MSKKKVRNGRKLPRQEPLIWPEVALLMLMNVTWGCRVIFVVLLAYKYLNGTLLQHAAPIWTYILFGVYFLLGGLSLLYTRSFWRESAPLRTRAQRTSAMLVRMVVNSLTVAIIGLELAWDHGHQDWTFSILTSFMAGLFYAALAFYLVFMATRWVQRSKPL
jgi:hypothetical protein